MFNVQLTIFLIFVFSCKLASAQDKKIQDFIQQDKKISKKIDGIASDIDSALSGKKSENEENKTALIVRNQLNWAEGGVYKYAPSIDLRLNLPNTEKKWQVTFSTYDEEFENRGVNRNRIKTSPSQENYGGGFRFLQKLGDVQTEFQPRIEIRGGVQLSYFLKFSSQATTGIYTFRPESHFFARTDKGLGQFIALNSDIKFFKVLTLTFVNEEQYQDRENVFSTNHGLVLSHDWGERTHQSYALIYESSSRPTFHLDRYTVSLGFRHEIYPQVIHYALTPYIEFPRNLDFRWSPGLNLEVDVIF